MKKINTIGQKEIDAVVNVMSNGNLSEFNAGWGEGFYGGEQVQLLEQSICKKFNVNHAITVNSWSSGLLIAVGSLGLEPGDEIIVSPWNMCSTVTSILQWLCVPVFCDIDSATFSIDPKKLESCITPRTRAIIANDMHGRSCDLAPILSIAKKYDLKVISDSAQSIGSIYNGQYSGTIADIGGFSFNWHKHINCGEGGVVITNNDFLAKKMQLLRNHAEGVVTEAGLPLNNMIGFNFRLTEIQAAIIIEQLKKLDDIIVIRQQNAKKIIDILSEFNEHVLLPIEHNNWTNVFCSFPMVFKNKRHRENIYQQLKMSNYPVTKQFSRGPVHRLPVFKNKTIFGKTDIPWCFNENSYQYIDGICPIAELLADDYFLDLSMEYSYSSIDLQEIKNVFSNTII